jgi:RNA polymerase sigma factor (sigma-70 family)
VKEASTSLATHKSIPKGLVRHSLNGSWQETASSGSTDQKVLSETNAADRIRPGGGLTMDLNDAPIRKVVEHFLQSQDPDAWAEITKRLRPIIRAAAAKRLRRSNQLAPPELLEDIEQDTHLKLMARNYEVLRNLKWGHDEAIYPYVAVAATRVVLDRLRKNKITPVSLDENQHTVRPKAIDDNIRREQIDKCLFTLSHEPNFKRDRAIFWLFYCWGYRAGQIARLPSVNLPEKTVENILQRLRGVVKSLLGI